VKEKITIWLMSTMKREEKHFRTVRTADYLTIAKEVILVKDLNTLKALLFQNNDFVFL
jgi:hypothetical protein